MQLWWRMRWVNRIDSAIDAAAMSHGNDHNHQPAIFDLGNHAEVAKAIAPVTGVIARHDFAAISRISEIGDFLQGGNDALAVGPA